jgi:hypothetical protein
MNKTVKPTISKHSQQPPSKRQKKKKQNKAKKGGRQALTNKCSNQHFAPKASSTPPWTSSERKKFSTIQVLLSRILDDPVILLNQ